MHLTAANTLLLASIQDAALRLLGQDALPHKACFSLSLSIPSLSQSLCLSLSLSLSSYYKRAFFPSDFSRLAHQIFQVLHEHSKSLFVFIEGPRGRITTYKAVGSRFQITGLQFSLISQCDFSILP